MPNFTEKEITLIQDMVSSHQLASKKLNTYASQCSDSNIKSMFAKASFEASQAAQNLINML